MISQRYICCSRLLRQSVISLALLCCTAIWTEHARSRRRSVLCIFMHLFCFPLTRGVTDVGHGNLSLYCFNSWKWVLFCAEDEISRGSHYQALQPGYYNRRDSHYLALSFLVSCIWDPFLLSLHSLPPNLVTFNAIQYLYPLQFLCLTKSHSLPLFPCLCPSLPECSQVFLPACDVRDPVRLFGCGLSRAWGVKTPREPTFTMKPRKHPRKGPRIDTFL